MNSLITKRCSPIEEAIYQDGYQAGAASRDAEVVSLTNQRDYEYVRAENAEQERDQFEQERGQLREHVKLLRDALITWGDQDTPLGVRIDTMVNALAATEPKL